MSVSDPNARVAVAGAPAFIGPDAPSSREGPAPTLPNVPSSGERSSSDGALLATEGPASAVFDVAGALVVRNTLLNLAGQGVPLFVVLATVPYLIRTLGQDRFGILALCWVVMNGAATFDFGLGRALRKLVAESLGQRDEARLARLAGSALVAQACSGGLGGLLLLGATPLLVEHALQIPAALVPEARATFFTLAFAVPVVVVMEGLFGILEAAQRFELVNAVKVPFYLSSALLPVAGVALGLGLDGVALMLLAAVVVICVVQASMCVRVFPVLWGVPRVHRVELRALAGFGGWVMVSNAVNPLLTYVERLAIGMLRSIGAVTRYTAPSEMIMRLSLLAACLSDTLFPAFSTLAGQGRFDVLATFASRAVKYLFLLLGPTVILTVAFGRGMLELWLGPGVQDESVTALQWLAVGVLVNSLASVPYAVVQACGRPDVTARFHLVELPVHAFVVWVLVSAWGIPGAALAWTLRVTLDAVLLFAAGDRLGFLPLRAFASGRVRLGALLLLVLGLVAFGTQSAGLPAMLARLSVPASGAAALRVVVPWFAALAASVSMWAFVLDDEDRAHARRAFGGSPSGEGT